MHPNMSQSNLLTLQKKSTVTGEGGSSGDGDVMKMVFWDRLVIIMYEKSEICHDHCHD